MIRRVLPLALAVVVLGLAGLVPGSLAGVAAAAPAQGRMRAEVAEDTTSTAPHLPRTDLEAEDRNGDNDSISAGWIAMSGVLAGGLVLVGGLWMRRRMAREA